LGRSFMTEGNGHAIDPAGEARRALQAAVAQHGPQALSNAVIMDGICRDQLSNLPGEAILIGSAARSDVPALLRDRVAREGTYGAIQSVATTLAEAHALDPAACVWVVREYARALGFIAPGGTQPTASAGPGAGQGAGQGGGPPAGGPLAGGGAGSRGLSRNALGISAAIALVLVYLGIAAVAHLSPFPAKTVASALGQGGNASNSASAEPDATPDAGPDPAPDPDPSPPSAYDTLLSLIPSSVQGQDNCHNAGTSTGATAVAQCAGLQGLAATTIDYYLFASSGALVNGFTSFLTSVKFPSSSQSCTKSNQFADFVPQCKDTFTSTSPNMTGSIAEYVSTQNDPIIVSTDNQQLVMGVLIGTNNADLLAYWKPLQWIQAQG